MNLDLQELIASLRRNDNTCLKIIFQEHSQYCIKYMVSKTNCTRDDADDIFIDSIINFREKLLEGKIKELTNIRGYLSTTCYQMWLTKYRKQKLHDSHADDLRHFYQEPDIDGVKKEDLFTLVNQAIESLGEKCQKIIKHFYLNKMTMEEIAQEMGFASAGVAKTLKARCYKKLIHEVREHTDISHVFSS